MTEKKTQPVQLDEAQLEDASGGLLLPAVQKVREAAARSKAPPVMTNPGEIVSGDGSV